MPGAAIANNKHRLSQGIAGFHSRCGETGEAVVQCLPAVAQLTRCSLPHSEGKGLCSYLGPPFSTQSAGQQEAVCHGLVCFAVSQWRWFGVWGKRGLGALLVKGEPTSHWATGRICKVVTSFVPTLGPWQCGEFPGLVRCGSER